MIAAFLQIIVNFVLQPTTKILKPSTSRCYNLQSVANVTRKDVIDDIFGFMAGAIAAETVISSVRFLRELERNTSIEKAFNILDTF
tara:strand:+ start:73 stop:330 length:258 start_codon:yes stop_codon:yes gene_type:complete